MSVPPSVNFGTDSAAPAKKALYLVCGLGGLGQYCASILIEFGVRVYGISAAYPSDWEVPDLPERLDGILIGDYRQHKILEQAEIRQAQAILLVANDEPANIEAAFTARLLNPTIRIVIRSAKQNLNLLLTQNLGNVVAYEPNQLATSAFALAALGGETQAIFQIDHEVLRVVKTEVQGPELGLGKPLHDFNSAQRQLISHHAAIQFQQQIGETESEILFYRWNPAKGIAIADTVTYIQLGSVGESLSALPDVHLNETIMEYSHTQIGERRRKRWPQHLQHLWTKDYWQQQLGQIWQRIGPYPTGYAFKAGKKQDEEFV